MPVFLVLRGAPASGKSTWIYDNGLEDITVSSDEVRLDIVGTDIDENGNQVISQENQGAVWREVDNRLEDMAAAGEPFIILDSTGLRRRDLKQYIWMNDEYGYDIYGVDFYSDIDADECKRRNAIRETLRYVPEHAIDRFYELIRSNPVPDFFMGEIAPDEAIELIESQYRTQ